MCSTPALKRMHILLSHPCAEVIHTKRCMAKVQWARCDFVHGVTNTNTAARWIALQRKLPMLQHYGAGMSNEDKKAVIFFSIAWISALSQSLVELCRVRVLLDLLLDITLMCRFHSTGKKYFGAKAHCFLLNGKLLLGRLAALRKCTSQDSINTATSKHRRTATPTSGCMLLQFVQCNNPSHFSVSQPTVDLECMCFSREAYVFPSGSGQSEHRSINDNSWPGQQLRMFPIYCFQLEANCAM